MITTSDFTEAAKQYAEKSNIKVIDGKNLVDLWLSSLDKIEAEENINNTVTILSPV